MKKSFCKLFFITILFSLPLISSARVSKIVFTNEELTVKPDTLSEQLTIQSQNSEGVKTNTSETIDLIFESSSPTGEFFTVSGNTLTKTISSGTANRNFSYKDSSEGIFTLMVKGTGRETGETWTASQKITVSSETSSGNADTSGEVLSASTESPNSSPQSATSGSVAPSYATVNAQLEVSAGGDRLTSPGSPISFQALIKKNSVANSSVNFSWSFGDGNVGIGALVTHVYKYPGEYAVVLNAKTGNTFAISRLKVKVAEPKLVLSEKDNYIEISNNTSSEINLFNWKIVCDHNGFVFQPDTIIFPNSSIKIDKSLLKMKGEKESDTVLKNYLGEIVATAPKTVKRADMEEIVLKTNEVWRETASILDKAIALNLIKESSPMLATVSKNNYESDGEVAGESVEYQQMLESGTTEEPLGEVIYESKIERSLMQKIIGFFAGIFDPVRNRK